LLTGDLQAAGERALLAGTTSTVLRADVLLVPHHGSRTSTGAALLAAVAPRLALVSAGRSNPFGHPHREVIDRLRSRGVPRLSTAESGWVRLRIDAAGRMHLSTPAAPVGP
jgi:competence protein ComEC